MHFPLILAFEMMAPGVNQEFLLAPITLTPRTELHQDNRATARETEWSGNWGVGGTTSTGRSPFFGFLFPWSTVLPVSNNFLIVQICEKAQMKLFCLYICFPMVNLTFFPFCHNFPLKPNVSKLFNLASEHVPFHIFTYSQVFR